MLPDLLTDGDADVVIAVNLNGDLVGRHGLGRHDGDAARAISAPPEFVTRLVNQMPTALREQESAILPKPASSPASPGYFQVLMTAIDVMQDQITRSRLAGEPPHVMLVLSVRRQDFPDI